MNLGKYLQDALAVAQRILLELVRRRRSLVLWAIFPVSMLFLNATILEERAQLTIAKSYALAAPLTIVGAALFFSCLGGSIATVVAEREQQTLKRLFLSPLTGFSYFFGIVLAHTAIGCVQTFLVVGVALIFGAVYEGSVLLGYCIILLSILSYVGVGFILGTQVARRTEDVNALVAAFGVPLLLLGGSFFPATFFPKNLLTWAQWNPVFHMNELLLGLVNNESWIDISYHFWFVLGFAIAMLLTGWFFYRRMLQIERSL